MQPTVYQSVDAAMEDLMTELPLMEQIKTDMEHSGKSTADPAGYERICSVVNLLRDRNAFRQRLEQLKNPDGSVRFSLTQHTVKRFLKFEQPGLPSSTEE